MTTRQYSDVECITSMTLLYSAGRGSEMYVEPILIGHWGRHGDGEIWIEQDGKRVQIPAEQVAVILREMRRAHKIAAEVAQEES